VSLITQPGGTPPANASKIHIQGVQAICSLVSALCVTSPCPVKPAISMPKLDDLPAAAVRLITRYARTRYIPGTNRYARVCRSWRDASIDSEDQEQLELVLALEGLPLDTFTNSARWLAQHGSCVTSLQVTYDSATAPLFQQLPLSTAPLASLARLEVDGPDSLVALAPALPHLVALTHLRASIGFIGSALDPPDMYSADRPLQQLCPGLKSLRLAVDCRVPGVVQVAETPLAGLLPAGLEQLHMHRGRLTCTVGKIAVNSAALTSLTALRCLTLMGLVADPDPLFHMPALVQLDLSYVRRSWHGGMSCISEWLLAGMCTAPQHQTKLTGVQLSQFGSDDSGAMQSLVTAAPSVCKLDLSLHSKTANDGAAAWAQELPGFAHLRHLNLVVWRGEPGNVAAAMLALSSLQQLTCLCFDNDSTSVPPSTWAAVLPHLTQLRVLGVPLQQLLEGGLAPVVPQLTQLQCLYIECQLDNRYPAATGAQVTPHLQVLSECSSLKAVLCGWYTRDNSPGAQPLWVYEHQGRLHLSCWHKWYDAAREGRVVCPLRLPPPAGCVGAAAAGCRWVQQQVSGLAGASH
jgi:hypothetical protein